MQPEDAKIVTLARGANVRPIAAGWLLRTPGAPVWSCRKVSHHSSTIQPHSQTLAVALDRQ